VKDKDPNAKQDIYSAFFDLCDGSDLELEDEDTNNKMMCCCKPNLRHDEALKF